MRPRKALATVIILLVVIFNIYMIARRSKWNDLADMHSQEAEDSASYQKPTKFQKDGNSWSGKEKDALNQNVGGVDSKNDLSGPGTEDGANIDESAKGNKILNANKNTKLDEKSAKEAAIKKGYLYNHGQVPPNYKKGLRQIKRILHKISNIYPNAGPFRPETDYFRDIKSDTSLQEGGELPATSMILGMYLQLSQEEVDALRVSHSRVMRLLPTSVPSKAFGGRGVVMTGGGKYFPMVLSAIRWLRETDPDIPIEVFMEDKSEYEERFCDGLFPKINVECRILRQIYGPSLSDKLNSKYALKPLAILASKFDDIYFMDADSYPLTSVNEIFDWDVYQDVGYILNSDYWPRYISPRFYEIVGRPLGGRARGDPNDHALLQCDRENAIPGQSTESGQIFVRKSQHIKSLMLAMYYNIYGPDVYFPLLMQNGHGEGDKDTYAAAAVICDEAYYQTQQRPVTLGQHRVDGYKGFAMGQPNPMVDYDKFEIGKDLETKMFALHANGIKSNIKFLMMDIEDPIRGAPRLRQYRFFGDMNNVRKEMRSNEDVEQRLFRVMRDVACQWVVNEGYIPQDWNEEDPKRLCRVLSAHTQWLRENPDVGAPEDALYWYDLDRRGKIVM